MRFPNAISFCIIGISCVLCCIAQPEVAAPTGRIRGSIIRSRLGKDIYSFRGIRYAEPPVGERRFRVSVPAADWDDVFDASQEGPACPNLVIQIPISEDCLRLNVYTTKLPSERENPKRSVLVYIHPGAFNSFSGQSLYWGPQYLLDQDIVLVTVNYRLATLGFISTGDATAPGNLGLKDQVIALRWIQRNIAAFGGDPNSVTICGYSVGGLSVMLHMVSPMSKGLFHRTIVMSGALMFSEPYPTEQIDLAQRQARLLDCPVDNNTAMLNCLTSRSVEDFTNSMFQFFEIFLTPVMIWKPVVEPEVPGVERFLPAQPVDLIQRGEFAQVPTIFGVTRDEFGGTVVGFNNLSEIGIDLYDMFDGRWYHEAPINFIYEEGTPRSRNISDQLRQFYFNGQPLNSDNGNNLAHLYADSIIIFPMYRGAKLIAENSGEPLYFYESTYQGRYSLVMLNATTPYGIVHGDDIQYLFYVSLYVPFLDGNAPEIPMMELYTSLWTSFVQTGKPILPGNAFRNTSWDRFVPELDNYLDINLEPTMRTNLYIDRMREWERIFPLPYPVKELRNYYRRAKVKGRQGRSDGMCRKRKKRWNVYKTEEETEAAEEEAIETETGADTAEK